VENVIFAVAVCEKNEYNTMWWEMRFPAESF
jgi:hypothetical protein